MTFDTSKDKKRKRSLIILLIVPRHDDRSITDQLTMSSHGSHRSLPVFLEYNKTYYSLNSSLYAPRTPYDGFILSIDR